MKKNKTLIIVLVVVFAVVAVLVGWGVGTRNGLVEKREAVTEAQSAVEVFLQRRADLIPNLVSTVKGYQVHEKEVYTELANARAALSGAKTVGEMDAANEQLSSALSRLLIVVENYPELKANEQFQYLMDELAGTENRIAKARDSYNEVAREYNTKIQKFPTSMIASMGHFDKAEYFKASADAQKVPEVKF